MQYKQVMTALLALTTALIAAAHEELPRAESAVSRAVEALDAASFHFDYSFWPNPQATGFTTGAGQADVGEQRWRYTVVSDSTDTGADRSSDGEWIIVGGAWYHNAGAGWVTGAYDFTFSGITAVVLPFASYRNLVHLAVDNEEALTELEFLGRENVDGLEADHYSFSVRDMPLYGTAAYDAWLSEDAGTFSRIILQFTPDGGRPNRVTFTRIGEPVDIAAPE